MEASGQQIPVSDMLIGFVTSIVDRIEGGVQLHAIAFSHPSMHEGPDLSYCPSAHAPQVKTRVLDRMCTYDQILFKSSQTANFAASDYWDGVGSRPDRI